MALPIGYSRDIVKNTMAGAEHAEKPKHLDGLIMATTGRAAHLAHNIVEDTVEAAGVPHPKNLIKSPMHEGATKVRHMGQIPYEGSRFAYKK